MLAKSQLHIKRLVLRTAKQNGEGDRRPSHEGYRSNRHCKVHMRAEARISNIDVPPNTDCNIRVRQSSLSLPDTEDLESPTSSLSWSPKRPQYIPACTCETPFVLGNLYFHGRPTNSGDARRWQLIFETPQRPLLEPTPACDEITITSTIDLIAALALEPPDGSELSARKRFNRRGLMATDLSENVRELIQESDEAFKADEFALPSPKDPSQGWYLADDDSTSTSSSVDPPHVALKRHLHKLTKRAFPGFKSKSKNRLESNFPEFRDTPPVSPRYPRPTTKSSSRWIMSEVADGVLDVFNGKARHRRGNKAIDDIRNLKAGGGSKYDFNRSYETLDSGISYFADDTLTPIEPFHLEDLPTRVTAAGIGFVNQESSALPPPIPIKSRRRHNLNILTSNSQTQDHLDLNVLTPPLSPKYRNRLSGSYLPDLSTIPEVSSTISRTSEANGLIFGRRSTGLSRQRTANLRRRRPDRIFFLTKDRKGKAVTGQGVDQTVLTSTPYSAISPRFRHGNIRLNLQPNSVPYPEQRDSQSSSSKVSLRSVHLHDDKILKVDDHGKRNSSLDWAAFQVAITGVAGDHLSLDSEALPTSYEAHLIREDLEREINELIEWWKDFGLEAGRMICEQPTEPDILTKNLKHKPPCVDFDISTSANLPVQARCLGSREDYDGVSLPPSPMEDINLADLRRKGSQYVPMGRNLHHDLRDYLSWRSGVMDEAPSVSERGEVGGILEDKPG